MGLIAVLVSVPMLTSACLRGEPTYWQTVLVLNRGDAVSEQFQAGFADAYVRRHPAIAARVKIQALRLPDDEVGYVRGLQQAVQKRPLLLVARNSYQAELVRRHAPQQPLLFQTYVDPREPGVVSSLNVHPEPSTGVWIADRLDAKRLETLLDAYPSSSHVGLVVDPSWMKVRKAEMASLHALARQRGARLHVLLKTSSSEVLRALDEPDAQAVQAWCLPRTPLSVDGRVAARLASEGRAVMTAHTPDIHGDAHLSYAPDKGFAAAALADLAARVLQGEFPGSIPIQTPYRYQLAVRISSDPRLPMLNPAVIKRADLVVRQ